MTIAELKSQLDILAVATHLGIAVDKHGKAHCPFHDDNTPSLQFSREKQIATCFSSNCTAGTMDVIALTEKKLGLTTPQALKYLSELAGLPATVKPPKATTTAPPVPPAPDYVQDFEMMQGSLLSSRTARDYLKLRGLEKLIKGGTSVGYNAFKNSRFSYLCGCIVFGLKDEHGKTVSLYGRSVTADSKKTKQGRQYKHFYTPGRRGLYPGYPDKRTPKLVLTESVIDAATLLCQADIIKDHQLLALYGTEGLTAEHVHAMQKLEGLQEIILFLDGDAAGKAATQKHGRYLHQLFSGVKLSAVETPEGEDINSLAQGHEVGVFALLLKQRKPLVFSFSKAVLSTEAPARQTAPPVPPPPSAPPSDETKKGTSGLDTANPYHLTYTTQMAVYTVKGGVDKSLDSMKVTLVIAGRSGPTRGIKSRNKLDLYEDKQAEKLALHAGEKLGLRPDLLSVELGTLTDHLETYREQTFAGEQQKTSPPATILSGEQQQKAIAFLSAADLMGRLNTLIGHAGVTGEEQSRLFLFGIAASYKMDAPLHALIQGSSGSGKTHLLVRISSFIPDEDRKHFTRVTEGSFYNYGKYDLAHKLICLEDLDGMREEAYLAFRELQSRGMIVSSTSGKDDQGNIRAIEKTVQGPIASMSCTTKGEIYEDNMNRCFLIAVDESAAQTAKIIGYQNRKAAGQVDGRAEDQATVFLQHCVRCLKPYPVVNPYAGQVMLPPQAHKLRRLNELYQSYVKQVTLLHQYQRSQDTKGRLISRKEDLQLAANIMFDSIVLKVDELDGSLRGFYERLKGYVKGKGERYEHYSFGQREVRQALQVSKSQLQRYLHDLAGLEYITRTGGYANRGYSYKILYWDNLAKLRASVKRHLQGQLDQLELAAQSAGSPAGSPAREEKVLL